MPLSPKEIDRSTLIISPYFPTSAALIGLALSKLSYTYSVCMCVYLQACSCMWSGRIFAKSLFTEVGQAFTWRFGGELQQGGLWTRGLRVREQKVNGRLIYERPPDRTEFSHPFRQILSSSNRPRLAPQTRSTRSLSRAADLTRTVITRQQDI